MYIFNSDLDNTLIYSYKHDIGADKINVEIYEDREISFITNKTSKLLKDVVEKTIFVPTTTRTIEQYKRIDLGIGIPKYALVCNGGILLKDGLEDNEWYMESLNMIKDSREELEKGIEFLDNEKRRNFEVRFIRELFVFTKCEEPEQVVDELRQSLDRNKVDIFNNGAKVYIVPKKLNKGAAILRLKEKLGVEKTIAAGDSEFDVSMIEKSDYGIAPKGLEDKLNKENGIDIIGDNEMFSEKVLEKVISICDMSM